MRIDFISYQYILTSPQEHAVMLFHQEDRTGRGKAPHARRLSMSDLQDTDLNTPEADQTNMRAAKLPILSHLENARIFQIFAWIAYWADVRIRQKESTKEAGQVPSLLMP